MPLDTKLSDLNQKADAVLALREKATKGKWSVEPFQFSVGYYIVTDAHELIRDRWVVDKVEMTDNAALIASIHQACDTLAAMMPLIEEAARYRWLRARNPVDLITVENGDGPPFFLGGDVLDAAIDAAMKHTEPEDANHDKT